MAKHPYKMWVNVADFLAKTQHLSEAWLISGWFEVRFGVKAPRCLPARVPRLSIPAKGSDSQYSGYESALC